MSQLTGAVIILLIAIPVALACYVGAALAREARTIRESARASRRKRGDT
ncbi:MAG: hypothetical protein KKH51_07425 [Actinobacteria bacterium]|nr:hypothetical protein [Actinomycetota bacterium]